MDDIVSTDSYKISGCKCTICNNQCYICKKGGCGMCQFCKNRRNPLCNNCLSMHENLSYKENFDSDTINKKNKFSLEIILLILIFLGILYLVWKQWNKC